MDHLSHSIFTNKAYNDIEIPWETHYIVPLDWYPNLLPFLSNTNILIIAGSHKKLNNYNNSNIYINEIKNRLSKNGNKVFTLLGCKEFIRSNGKFSKLLSNHSL